MEQLSVARTVNVEVPEEDGVPVINPDEFIVIPAGNEPEIMLKVTGA